MHIHAAIVMDVSWGVILNCIVLLGVGFNGKAPHTPCCNLVALLYANVLYMTSSLVLEVNLFSYIYLCVGKPSPLCGLRTPTKINDSTMAALFRDKWKIH